MISRPRMELLLKLPGADYEAATQPFRQHLEPYVTRMTQVITEGGPLSRVPAFRDYSVYCGWAIRQLEYSFVIRSLPFQPSGRALDVGSSVTPWPESLAAGGWPMVAIDTAVDEVIAIRRHGAEAFGAVADRRVADARGMGFSDAQFALVTCISMLERLHHVDVPVALAEMVRVCQPGGRIVLTLDVRAADDPDQSVGESSFLASELEQIFAPLARACGSQDELASLLDALRRLSLRDLEAFWTQHWKPGLWAEKNRGYGAAGLVFDLPGERQQCRDLVVQLRDTALQMDYPPDGAAYRQLQGEDGSRLWVVGDDVLAAALAAEGFESDVRSFFEHFLRPGDCVFDVGANVGYHTVLFSRLVGPSGEVHAFEPTGLTFGCLVRNTLGAGMNCRLNRMGASHESQPQEMRYGAHGNACLNSFGEPFGAGAAATGAYLSEKVWATTLDAYVRDYEVERIDLVKIDVEGWEERVLRGAVSTLLSRTPVLVLEYCSAAARNADSSCVALSDLIAACGYHLFQYHPAARLLHPVEASRDAWRFANLIAIHDSTFNVALDRLAGVAVPTPGSRPHPDTAREPMAPRPAGAPDTAGMLLLLQENRSLRLRLTAGILDLEVTTLMQHLQRIETDSSARLAAINQLTTQLRARDEKKLVNRLRRILHLLGLSGPQEH